METLKTQKTIDQYQSLLRYQKVLKKLWKIKLMITSRKTITAQYSLGFVVDFLQQMPSSMQLKKIRLSLDNKKKVASALLEPSKAFDSLSHNLLLAKLKSFNFDTSAINMIKSYLKNWSQKVVLQNVSSNWIHLYQGVPHGTILGPLLFNLYVNSMINTIIKLWILSIMLMILSFS